MQKGYAVVSQLETLPDEVNQFVISEQDFRECAAYGLVESVPDADWESYTISCSQSQWLKLEIDPIKDFPVIVVATIFLLIAD